MKKTSTIFLLFLLMCNVSLVSAQEKKFRFELGVNYPIDLRKNGFKESHIGIYLNETYNLSDNPLSVSMKLSYESYTMHITNYSNNPYNGRSISLVPSVNYHFGKNQKVKFHVGIGTGVSVDNIETGVFNAGYKYHLVVVPQIGVRFINHINLSLQYNITHKDFSRLMLGVGYVF